MSDTRSRQVFTAILLLATLGLLALNAALLTPQALSDVSLYDCYARGFWQGAAALHHADWPRCASLWQGAPLRFHALPREYPAPALAIFSLPLLFPWWSYTTACEVWMALPVLAISGLLAWRGLFAAAIAFPLYLFVAGWSFALARYDLIPGLCVLVALLCVQNGTLRLATLALAVGTLFKGFPVLLLPLVLLAGRRGERGSWRLDLVLLFVAICVAGFLPALLLDAAATTSPLRFASERPLQIESLPGNLLWLTANAGLGPAPGLPGGPSPEFSYNSLNIAGGGQTFWGLAFGVAGLAAMVAAYRRAWRGNDSPGRSVIVLLLALLVAGKVLSPQYLLWLLPAAALVEGPRLRWLLLCAPILLIMHDYFSLPLRDLPWDAGFNGAILLRNMLLCTLTVLYLVTPGDLPARHWPSRPLWAYIWHGRG